MKEITVYSWTTCPYCDAAKAKLTEMGLPYTEIDATPAEIAKLKESIGVAKITVPQIFVGDYRVGGWDNMKTLLEKNLFHTLLED